MKIYLVSLVIVKDYCEEEPINEAFAKMEDAIERFRERSKEVKDEFAKWTEADEGEWYCEIWEEDRYCENHARVMIETLEVK